MEGRPLRVLYVEDDDELAAAMREWLEREDMRVQTLRDGVAALARLDTNDIDTVLIDVSLPGGDGLALCRQIRTSNAVPVIVVTGNGDPGLAARALDDGADDFVRKPFDVCELVARIRAHVRRARGEMIARRQQLRVGPLVIDLAMQMALREDEPVALTSTEFAVLAALARNVGRPLSREQLLEVVHGTAEQAFERSIDVLVSRLRGKLEVRGQDPGAIRTVRGVGYMLVAASSAHPAIDHSR